MWQNARGELNAIGAVLAAVGAVAGATGAVTGSLAATIVGGIALTLALPVVARMVHLRLQRDGDRGEHREAQRRGARTGEDRAPMSPRVVRVLRFGPGAGLLLIAFAVREHRVLTVLTLASALGMTVITLSVPAEAVGKASWRMRFVFLALMVAGVGLGLLLSVIVFR